MVQWMHDHREGSRGRRNLYNVMNSWAPQRAPLMLPALLHLLQSIPSTMQHAWTCRLLGDHRWSEQGPETTCSGDFLPALHFTEMGLLGFCRLRRKGEGANFRDRLIRGNPPVFSISSSQPCVNTNDMLCATTHIYSWLHVGRLWKVSHWAVWKCSRSITPIMPLCHLQQLATFLSTLSNKSFGEQRGKDK